MLSRVGEMPRLAWRTQLCQAFSRAGRSAGSAARAETGSALAWARSKDKPRDTLPGLPDRASYLHDLSDGGEDRLAG